MKRTYVFPELAVESIEVENGIATSPFAGEGGVNVEAGDYGDEVEW